MISDAYALSLASYLPVASDPLSHRIRPLPQWHHTGDRSTVADQHNNQEDAACVLFW